MSEFFNPFLCGWCALAVANVFDAAPWWVRYPVMFATFAIGRMISDHLSIVIPT